MNFFEKATHSVNQIVALVIKDIKLSMRFKMHLIIRIISPIIAVLMPIIIMTNFFSFNKSFGTWNDKNFMIYILLAYNITLIFSLINQYSNKFNQEKFWQTLPALIIGSISRFNLLMGIYISYMIVLFVPLTIVFLLCFLYYPISFFTAVFIIFIFFLTTLMISGIGMILGVLQISRENYNQVFIFLVSIIFWGSCVMYPFEIFPSFIQQFIELNPLYHIFDILRQGWIEDNVTYTIQMHFIGFLLVISFSIVFPLIGVLSFNGIYNKYGIVGY